MVLRRFLRRVVRDRSALQDQLRPHERRAKPGSRPQVEQLESWELPNLLLSPIPFATALGAAAVAHAPLAGASEGYSGGMSRDDGHALVHATSSNAGLGHPAPERFVYLGRAPEAARADVPNPKSRPPASWIGPRPSVGPVDLTSDVGAWLPNDLDFLDPDPAGSQAHSAGTADVSSPSSPRADVSDPATPSGTESLSRRNSEPPEVSAPQNLASAGSGPSIPFLPRSPGIPPSASPVQAPAPSANPPSPNHSQASGSFQAPAAPASPPGPSGNQGDPPPPTGGSGALTPPALVVGRTLSSYTTGGVQNNQLSITYTVYNEQADPLSGVLLTDTLMSGVTFQSASALPDRSGPNLAWSLGTVGGFDRASVTLTVSLVTPLPLQLDIGAQAFATLDAGLVSNATPAAMLRPGSVDPSLLASTPDANTTDPFVQEEAAKLNYDPQQIFDFLHNDVGYNSYLGSVRGARGTLWSSAGNALDVASLGVALMRASGIPAQYAQGTLSQTQAQQLILSMFPASFQTVGYIPAGTQTADPAHDPQLLAETTAHYWFQFDAGSGMQDADPLMAGAEIGQTFTASTGTFTVVPDNLREKTEVKLTAEIFSQASAAFGGNPLTTTAVLDQTFNDVDLVGRPLSVGNFISSTSSGAILSFTTNTYTSYLDRGDEADPAHDTLVEGTPYQEVLTNYPLGAQVLTGLFLNVTLSGPLGPAASYQSTMLDRIGYAARQGGTPTSVAVPATPLAAVQTTTIQTINVLPGLQSPAAKQPVLDHLRDEGSLLSAVTPADVLSGTSFATLRSTVITAHQAELVQYALLAQQEVANLEVGDSAAAYFDRPSITIAGDNFDTASSSEVRSFNLLNNSMRVIPAPGQSTGAAVILNLTRGLFDNAVEDLVVPKTSGGTSRGTFSILQQAISQRVPFATIARSNLETLSALNLPADVQARITTAVEQGEVVITPVRTVMIGTTATITWLEINPTTGEVSGVLPDGTRSDAADETVTDGNITFRIVATLATEEGTAAAAAANAELFAANEAVVADTIANKAGIVAALKAIVAGAVGTTTGGLGAAAVLFAFVEGNIAILEAEIAAGDPPLPALLLGLNFPFPDVSPNPASGSIQVAPNTPAGLVAGADQASSLALAGGLAASWASAATSAFQAGSITASSATVVDASGRVAGSGAVALTAASSTPVAVSGNDQYSASGTGSLSFYGPAESSLGVSGNWNAYSATVTGNLAITLTTDGLTLNGQALPAGTYTISTSSATLAGSGPSTSPNFSGSASINATGGTLYLGPGSGNVTVGGNPLDLTSGATLTGYTGALTVAAGGGSGTDSVPLNGSAANVLRLSATPATLTADENTPTTFHANVQTSFADTYHLTAKAPPGWTVSLDNSQNVTVTPAPGLQGRTCAVQLIAQSTANPDLVAQTTVNVTVTPTQPGTTLSVVPDPVFSVPFNGAQLPTAFRGVIHNNGPAAVTENLTFPSVPSGFTLLASGTRVTVPAGQTGVVGVYLQATGAQVPAVGTPASFTVTATNASNPADVHTVNNSFTVPAVTGITLASAPLQVNTAPGLPGTATLTATNVGNVPDSLAVDATASAGLTVAGLGPVSPGVGQSTTQTITLTPAAGTPLNSSLAATILAAPPLPRDAVAVLQVAPSPAFVEAAQQPDISATVFTGVSQPRQALASYTVTNPSGTVVFTSAAVPVHLSAVATTTPVDLGLLDTTGFGPGAYTVTVSLREQSGQAIPGASGSGTLLVHSPVTASLSLNQPNPSPLPPGDGTVTSTLLLGNNTTTGNVMVTAQAQVPKNRGVAVVPSSFSLAPTQILDGPTFQTLVWTLPLAPGAVLPITWQSTLSNLQPGEVRQVTLATTIQSDTTASFTLAPLNVAAAPPVQSLVIPVQVVVPGAQASASAAVSAGQAGETNLATQLTNLATDLTNLVQNTASAVFKSQVLADLDAVTTLLPADPFLAQFTAAVTTARGELASAVTASDFGRAFTDLANAMTSVAAVLADEAAHGFTLSLSPNSVVALPAALGGLGLVLRNTGSQTTI